MSKKKLQAKTLIMIRHAHRDTSHREADNGLSKKGHEQAKALLKYFKRQFSKEELAKEDGFYLVSSPKKRCVETLEGIAESSGESIEVMSALTEQGPSESESAFEKRIAGFLDWWKDEAPSLVILCSHGDWLPLAIHQLTGAFAEVRKAGWCQIEANKEGELRVESLLASEHY